MRKLSKYDLGERIRELRREQGYTSAVLAEKADLSERFLSDVENGKKGISTETIVKLAIALKTNTDYLLFGSKGEEDMVTLCLSRIKPEKQKEAEAVFCKIIDLIETQ